MIIVTKPKEEDIVQIQELFYKTWLDTYPNKEAGITKEDIKEHFKDRLSPETLERRRRGLLTESENQFFFVAKDGEKVVGICRLMKRENCNQLQAIYVLPEYQRKGVGHMLWEKTLTLIDPKKEYIVQVATYNERAINFYKKLGFVDNGKRFAEEKHRMPISKSLIPEMEMTFKKP